MSDLKTESSELKRMAQGVGVYLLCTGIQAGKVASMATRQACTKGASKIQSLVDKIQAKDHKLVAPRAE